MRLLIYWHTDGDALTRKFLRRELIEAPQCSEGCIVAWFTEDAIWKNIAVRRLQPAEFEEELRNPPRFVTAGET
jgi:hypothetical protein